MVLLYFGLIGRLLCSNSRNIPVYDAVISAIHVKHPQHERSRMVPLCLNVHKKFICTRYNDPSHIRRKSKYEFQKLVR